MQAHPLLSTSAPAPVPAFAPAFAGSRAAPQLSVSAPARGDAAIRQRLLADLGRQPWWHGETANLFVADGTVIFQGLFHRQAERRAAREMALASSGVHAVRDDRVRACEWQAMG